MNKQLLLPVGILLGGLTLTFLIMATKEEPKADPDQLAEAPKLKAEVQLAQTQTATLSVETQGSVTAKREIDIVAQVSGKIVAVTPHFVDGMFVEQGELLIQIDDRDHQAALISARSRVKQSERSLAEERGRSRQAKNEWRDLGKEDANNLFLRKPQLAEAEAQLASAKAELSIAELNIERTQIRLPFNARIKDTLVNVGQFISIGTKIASVYDTATVEVRLPLSDRQMALLDLPISSSQFSSAPEVVLSGVIAGKEHQWLGHIKRTEASVDVRTRMYFAIAEVEEPFSDKHSAPLLPGLFVEARIAGKQLDNVLVLPKESLVNRKHLYTLNENNEIELTPVTVLNKKDGKVWLHSNLSPDERVLIEKHAVVSPGLEIEPILQESSIADDGAATDSETIINAQTEVENGVGSES